MSNHSKAALRDREILHSCRPENIPAITRQIEDIILSLESQEEINLVPTIGYKEEKTIEVREFNPKGESVGYIADEGYSTGYISRKIRQKIK